MALGGSGAQTPDTVEGLVDRLVRGSSNLPGRIALLACLTPKSGSGLCPPPPCPAPKRKHPNGQGRLPGPAEPGHEARGRRPRGRTARERPLVRAAAEVAATEQATGTRGGGRGAR